MSHYAEAGERGNEYAGGEKACHTFKENEVWGEYNVRTELLMSKLLKWAFICLIIAALAALFGYSGLAADAADLAKLLFTIFGILFLILLVLGVTIYKKVT